MTQYITVSADDRAEAKNGIVKLHGSEGFEGMRRAGRLAAEILDALASHVVPGVSTDELDDIVHKMTLTRAASPATAASELTSLRRSDTCWNPNTHALISMANVATASFVAPPTSARFAWRL